MDKKRLLLYSEGWGTGGIENFIMNIARNLNRDFYDFDIFCTHDYDAFFDEEIESLGGRRFTVFHNAKPSLPVRVKSGLKEWRKLLASNGYDAVHVNTMNGSGFLYTDAARQMGVPIRIIHSHNNGFSAGHKIAKTVAHNLFRLAGRKSPTLRLACSMDAGRYLFGREQFEVFHNCINIERFRFNPSARKELRRSIGISDDAFVMGFVGRLFPSKNPLFVMEIFASLKEVKSDARLIMIGQGELREELHKLAQSYGLSDSVFWLDKTNDVPAFFSAMDVYCGPSTIEGLALTTVEAMASGLPFVGSDVYPDEAKAFTLMTSLSLDDDASTWAKRILEEDNSLRKAALKSDLTYFQEREAGAQIMMDAGYGPDTMKAQLGDIYNYSL